MHCIFKVRENKSHVQGEKGCGSLGREGLLKVNKRFTVFFGSTDIVIIGSTLSIQIKYEMSDSGDRLNGLGVG